MRKIFFHFGPGGNPFSDKEILADSSITFWKQPHYTGTGPYISDLLNKASHEVIKHDQRVEIIAHSFGAFIAENLDQDAKSFISKATYIAPTFDFFTAITHMIENLVILNDDHQFLNELRTMKMAPTSKKFWLFFGDFVTKYPNYLESYFKDKSGFKKYQRISSKFEGLHGPTLSTAVTELIDDYRIDSFTKSYDNTKVILGEYDPLIPSQQQNKIKAIFGKENVDVVDSGHFPHFETSISL